MSQSPNVDCLVLLDRLESIASSLPALIALHFGHIQPQRGRVGDGEDGVLVFAERLAKPDTLRKVAPIAQDLLEQILRQRQKRINGDGVVPMGLPPCFDESLPGRALLILTKKVVAVREEALDARGLDH